MNQENDHIKLPVEVWTRVWPQPAPPLAPAYLEVGPRAPRQKQLAVAFLLFLLTLFRRSPLACNLRALTPWVKAPTLTNSSRCI